MDEFYRTVELNLDIKNIKNSASLQIHSLLTHAKQLLENARVKINNISMHKRVKRGLLNIVGKTSKWLFGTLDSADEGKYDKAIGSLQNNINHEMSLQISLTKQLINNYNDTITRLDSNQKLIKIRLEDFQNQVNKTLDNISSAK
ncbi:hypothetical protein ABEB36_014780 [Hypothenemus hampei]|uniref:Uncharacterized protein n=1 Tax=Hypothenemus hampei TaxID=57062 RepID=A0ABD1E3P4_HYPHA